jgi:hypothetical protein
MFPMREGSIYHFIYIFVFLRICNLGLPSFLKNKELPDKVTKVPACNSEDEVDSTLRCNCEGVIRSRCMISV